MKYSKKVAYMDPLGHPKVGESTGLRTCPVSTGHLQQLYQMNLRRMPEGISY